jgi:hypothetical protein
MSTLAPPTDRPTPPLARLTPAASKRAAVSGPSTRLPVLVQSDSGENVPAGGCFGLTAATAAGHRCVVASGAKQPRLPDDERDRVGGCDRDASANTGRSGEPRSCRRWSEQPALRPTTPPGRPALRSAAPAERLDGPGGSGETVDPAARSGIYNRTAAVAVGAVALEAGAEASQRLTSQRQPHPVDELVAWGAALKIL